jgi:UPF0755 protein
MNNYMNGRQQTQQRKKNPLITLFIYFVLFSIVTVGATLTYYYRMVNNPTSKTNQIVQVRIEVGDGREVIAQKLVDAGLLNSKNNYIWYTKISDVGGKVQAGSHTVNKNMSLKEIVAQLESKPDDTTVWVTIKEGLRYDEIAHELAKVFEGKENVVFSAERYIQIAENPSSGNFSPDISDIISAYLPTGKNLEGFLYPDTYNFKVEATEEEIITIQINTLMSKIGEDNWRKIEENNLVLYDILNVAAMLEREGRNDDEFAMIADIINRRLNIGMALGIDATTLYELKDWKAVITIQHLRANTPYNTRLNTGLPPTPISNPGIRTIDAAINPTSNDYLYYIHDNSGKIHYAKTNAEHEANVREYLR